MKNKNTAITLNVPDKQIIVDSNIIIAQYILCVIKKMPSVIEGMTMSEVRQCLQQIRRSWNEQTPWVPFNPSAKFKFVKTQDETLTMSKFAWMFVIGHHINRKRQKQTDSTNLIKPL